MTIAEARAAIAAALSTVDGYDVRARPWRAAERPGDGWVVITSVRPGEFFSAVSVTFRAVLLLSADQLVAEESLETDAAALVLAVTKAETLLPANVDLSPVEIPVGTARTPYFAAVLTLTMEV